MYRQRFKRQPQVLAVSSAAASLIRSVVSWANGLTSRSLSVLICKKGIMKVSPLRAVVRSKWGRRHIADA